MAPKMNERGMAQTISLSFKQMIVFGNRFKNLKSKKVSPPEQMPSDAQLVRTVLDGMNIVVLDEGAPDQAMEGDSNEVLVVGEINGEVVCLSDPGNVIQTDSTTSEEPTKATEVSLQLVSSITTDSSTPSAPGPSGSKANTKDPPHVPKNVKKPSKPNGKELAGDRYTKGGNGKKTEGKSKVNTSTGRFEPAYSDPSNRWVCGWYNCQRTNIPTDNNCWNCGGYYGSRGDYRDNPLPYVEPEFVCHEGYGTTRGRGGGRGGNRFPRGPGSNYATRSRGRGRSARRGGRKGN